MHKFALGQGWDRGRQGDVSLVLFLVDYLSDYFFDYGSVMVCEGWSTWV